MKLEISVKFIDEDGTEATKPVVIDTTVPGFDDFHDVNDFLPVFDQLEKAGLELRNESFSTALTQYMEELSKKLPGQPCTQAEASYVMETEAGRLSLHLFSLPGVHTETVFPPVSPRERLQSSSYKEVSLWLCTLVSFRESAAVLNRMLHRSGGDTVHTRTLADSVAREGRQIEAFQEQHARDVLQRNGFCPETCLPVSGTSPQSAAPQAPDIPEDRVCRAIQRCSAARPGQEAVDEACLHSRMEEPALTTYVSIDDIGVTRQKDSRKPGEERATKYVENTVVHVANGAGRYILAGVGMAGVLRLLVAFLLSNGLMEGKNLVFFTDGAKNIRSSLEKLFPYRPYTIILDWYHLEKKCREYLSSALKGRGIRNQVSEAVLRHLWIGDVERATDYLLHLDGSLVKSREWLEKLVQYLDKNYSYIPCYALRKELGLRNSSNPVEKANDTVVAQRQKHNGMSWSKGGSSALTHIRALYLNDEDKNWNKGETVSSHFILVKRHVLKYAYVLVQF